MKNRILQAYRDNHIEWINAKQTDNFEEEAYCEGFETALEFVMALLNISL